MAKKIRDRLEDAADSSAQAGEEVRQTFFGSVARSAVSAAVSVTVTFATGWLLKKAFAKLDRSGGSAVPR
ncbi:MAG: hypothetical protein J7496_01890 [Novosphingobium sp.]|nr:hypothetical protein [Novosphingobium sp.]